jgi:hypothetical protein
VMSKMWLLQRNSTFVDAMCQVRAMSYPHLEKLPDPTRYYFTTVLSKYEDLNCSLFCLYVTYIRL